MGAAARFWRNREEYHDLARRFEEGIDIVHPDALTGRSGCGYRHACGWYATTQVIYLEYRGEAV